MNQGEQWFHALQNAVAQEHYRAVTPLVMPGPSQDVIVLIRALFAAADEVSKLSYIGEKATDKRIMCFARTPWDAIVELPLAWHEKSLRLEPAFDFGSITPPVVFDIGTIADYAKEGVYPGPKYARFLVVSLSSGGLLVLSTACSYRAGTIVYLAPEDRTLDSDELRCMACSSTYSKTGVPRGGPAPEPLRRLPLIIDPGGRLHVLADDSRWLPRLLRYSVRR